MSEPGGENGGLPVRAPQSGRVAELRVTAGAEVHAGELLALVEVMKMEAEVRAPQAGRVGRILVEEGSSVEEGDDLLELVASESARSEPGSDERPDVERSDLAEVIERGERARSEDRPAVARRRARGGRLARENLADLVDEGTFVEYGALAIAAQRGRRSEEELIAETPGDGVIAGIGRVNGELFADAGRCAVMSYDYTVLAGTQGAVGHMKKDRLFELVERLRLPVVLFAEGGGGRPGDTDYATGSALMARAFALWGRLSGLVPRIAIVAGRCFAGNAALAGSADLLIATEDSSIGMGGPAMVEGGGLGSFGPEEIGPIDVQHANGVVDVRVPGESEAVAAAKRLLSYFQGPISDWAAADQAALRTVVPENRRRTYDVREVIGTLTDAGWFTELRDGFAPSMVTGLARLEGRPVGVIANDCRFDGGAITSDGADKAARMMQLCDAFGLPVLALLDTPGMMVGPEAEKTALVRHTSRLFAIGPNLSVPLLAVVLRRGYGLGAQAMVGGSFAEPVLSLAWPSGELGPMGIEGAVRLGMRGELDAIDDPAEREGRFRELVAGLRRHFRALNVATYFEIDDVVDPADTRDLLARALRSLPPEDEEPGRQRGWIDAW